MYACTPCASVCVCACVFRIERSDRRFLGIFLKPPPSRCDLASTYGVRTILFDVLFFQRYLFFLSHFATNCCFFLSFFFREGGRARGVGEIRFDLPFSRLDRASLDRIPLPLPRVFRRNDFRVREPGNETGIRIECCLLLLRRRAGSSSSVCSR